MNLVSLLFSFQGRINRARYWFGNLGAGFAGGLLMILIAMLGMASPKNPAPMLIMLGLLFLAMAWVGAAIQVKRFHDRGQSGYWALLPFAVAIPIFLAFGHGIATNAPIEAVTREIGIWMNVLMLINFGFFINLGCLAGTDGPNKYDGGSTGGGSSPFSFGGGKKPEASAAFLLGGAQSAMDRAINENNTRPAAPAPVQPAMRPAMAGAAPTGGGFGKRVAR